MELCLFRHDGVLLSELFLHQTMEQAEAALIVSTLHYSRLNYYRLMTDSPRSTRHILAAPLYRRKKFNEQERGDALASGRVCLGCADAHTAQDSVPFLVVQSGTSVEKSGANRFQAYITGP